MKILKRKKALYISLLLVITILFLPNMTLIADNFQLEQVSPIPVKGTYSSSYLPDGKVVFIGDSSVSPYSNRRTYLYDSATDVWRLGTDLPLAKGNGNFSASTLNDDTVLITGGIKYDSESVYGGESIRNCYVYNPNTDIWSSRASLPSARQDHGQSTMADGQVLITGGHTANGIYFSDVYIYTPSDTSGSWTKSTSLPAKLFGHSQVTMSNGEVMVFGGHTLGAVYYTPYIYNPTTKVWRTGAANSEMWNVKIGMVALSDGSVLVAGSDKFAVYHPEIDTWDASQQFGFGSQISSIRAVLPNDDILVTSGTTQDVYIMRLNKSPVINITTPLQGQFYSSVTGFNTIEVKGTIKDRDLGDKDYLKYNIDGGSSVYLSLLTGKSGNDGNDYITADGNAKSFTAIPISVTTLVEGSHTLNIQAIDNKGAVSTIAAIPFKMDKTKPVLSNVTTTSTATSITVAGSATDALSGLGQKPYRYTISAATDWIANTSFTRTTLVPNTSYPVNFEAIDAVGNIASKSINIYTKAVVPNLSITNIAPYSLTLSTSDNNPVNTQYQISINNGSKYVTPEGTLTTSPVWITLTNRKINIMGLDPSQTYSFAAKAKHIENPGGDEATSWSAAVSATTLIQPPSPPTNITATATSNSIDVLWDPVEDSTSYEIEVDGVVKNNGTYTAYNHTGLNQNTPHTYRIRAKNAGGTGDWSSLITKYTQLENPNTPFNIDAAATNTSIIVTWQPISGATNYDIEVDGEIVNNYSSTNYVHTGLIPGTTHSYRVRSINSTGRSPWSHEIVITTQTEASPTPENLRTETGSGQITVTWDEIDGATYEIEVDGNIKDNGTSTTYIHNNLTSGSEHSYRVRTKLSGNTSAWSAIETATVPEAVFGTPTNIKTEATDTTITLSWSPVLDATGYEVDIDGIVLDNGIETACIHDGLEPNSYHSYRVRAIGTEEESEWSDELTVTTFALSTPKNVEVFATGDVISINWDEVDAAESYDLEINDVLVGGVTDSFYNYEGEPNTQYNFRVRAVNGHGTSSWSKSIKFVTTTEEIDAPQNMTAVAKNTAITVLWSEVQDAASYEIEVDGNLISGIDEASLAVTGLEPGSMHTFRVRAKVNEEYTDWSRTISVKTISKGPVTPTNLIGSASTTSVLLTWDKVENAVEYELEVDGELINIGMGITYLHTGLAPDSQHMYRVRARNTTEISLWSDFINISTASSVNTFTIDAEENEVFSLVLTASNIQDPTRYTYTITYDADKLELIDLCSNTSRIDLSTGNVIGSDIQVLQVEPGRIVFKKLGNTSGQSWTGLVNSIKFRNKIEGTSDVEYRFE